MDAFSYLSVLFSIIIGLAIAQVLQGYRALLLSRSRLVFYAPSLIWSFVVLLAATQSWWASFGLAQFRSWTFGVFAVILLQAVLLYMMAGIVLPDMPAKEAVDLRLHYERERIPFFLTFLLLLAVSIAKDWMLGGLPAPENLAFHGAFAAICIVALTISRKRLHDVLAPVTALLLLAYIGRLFAHL